MSRFALHNPMVVVMGCIALVVFSLVVVPRLSIDTLSLIHIWRSPSGPSSS